MQHSPTVLHFLEDQSAFSPSSNRSFIPISQDACLLSISLLLLQEAEGYYTNQLSILPNIIQNKQTITKGEPDYRFN